MFSNKEGERGRRGEGEGERELPGWIKISLRSFLNLEIFFGELDLIIIFTEKECLKNPDAEVDAGEKMAAKDGRKKHENKSAGIEYKLHAYLLVMRMQTPEHEETAVLSASLMQQPVGIVKDGNIRAHNDAHAVASSWLMSGKNSTSKLLTWIGYPFL